MTDTEDLLVEDLAVGDHHRLVVDGAHGVLHRLQADGATVDIPLPRTDGAHHHLAEDMESMTHTDLLEAVAVATGVSLTAQMARTTGVAEPVLLVVAADATPVHLLALDDTEMIPVLSPAGAIAGLPLLVAVMMMTTKAWQRVPLSARVSL